VKPKRNKPSSPSNNKKKSVTSSDKSAVRKNTPKLDDKKIASISETITKINNKFETLIDECKNALHYLNNQENVA